MGIDYDASKALKRIENDLIDSMIQNFKNHRVEEVKEGFEWEQWQVLQLKALEKYRLKNPEKYAGDFTDINKRVEEALMTTYQTASAKEEAKILQKIKAGKIKDKRGGAIEGSFFSVNEGRLAHLIDATKADFTRGEWSMLRQANDKYRKIIFDAQMYAATGSTYEQAVDMATKDFLKAGIQSITYKNGARHTMADYASMAIRTGQKRAYLMGEGDVHDKYGIHTVQVAKRVDACPLCVKWLGRVLVDDVYSGGTYEEAKKAGVPLLSEAIDEGFLHPNCKDIYTLYIEGISEPAKPWTKDEMQEIADGYNQEQAYKRAEDMADSYGRMAKDSLDPDNQKRYKARAEAWKARADMLAPSSTSVFAELGAILDEPAEPEIKLPTYTMANGQTATTKPLGQTIKAKKVPFEKKLNPKYEDYKAHIAVLEKAKADDAILKPLYAEAMTKADEKIAEMTAQGIYHQKMMPVFKAKKKYAKKIQAIDVKDEIKTVEASIKSLEADANNYKALHDAEFAGIWQQPAYLSEYETYAPKIKAKQDYFSAKVDEWQNKGVAEYGKTQAEVDAKVDQLMHQWKDVNQYQTEGAKYQQEIKKLQDDIKKAQEELEQKQDELLKLTKPKEWAKKHASPSGTITQEMRDKGLWTTSKKEADAKLRPRTGEVWRNATDLEKNAIYEYTVSYSKFNEPLRGIEYGTNAYKGVGKTTLNPRNNGKFLNAMTDIIERSTYDFDMWFNRGVNYSGMDKFFGVSQDFLRHASQADLEKHLLGKEVTEYGFMSMGSAKGQGFSGGIKLNIFAPKGTKMMYAEPFSGFGRGAGRSWDGISTQSSFGTEFETILQQGTRFRITKVERSGGTLYIDMDVIAQDTVQRWTP